MKRIVIADSLYIDAISKLRVEQQIEDWNNTSGKSFEEYSDEFFRITKEHLTAKLNESLYFVLMYIDDLLVAMCALEELSELPQITVCSEKNHRHGWISSVYTKPSYRGNGYQQELMRVLLDLAENKGFTEITLTTNTPDAKHIYEKFGFEYISDKYYLNLKR